MDVHWERIQLALQQDITRCDRLARAQGSQDRWERNLATIPSSYDAPALPTSQESVITAKRGYDAARRIHGSNAAETTYRGLHGQDPFARMHETLSNGRRIGNGENPVLRTAFTAGYLSGLGAENVLLALRHANFGNPYGRDQATAELYTSAFFPPVVRTVATHLLEAETLDAGLRAAANDLSAARLRLPASTDIELMANRADYSAGTEVVWAIPTPGGAHRKVADLRESFSRAEPKLSPLRGANARTLCLALPRVAGELNVVDIDDAQAVAVTERLTALAGEQLAMTIYSDAAMPPSTHALVTNWPGLATRAAAQPGSSQTRVDHVVHLRQTPTYPELGKRSTGERLTDIPVGPGADFPLEGLDLNWVLAQANRNVTRTRSMMARLPIISPRGSARSPNPKAKRGNGGKLRP